MLIRLDCNTDNQRIGALQPLTTQECEPQMEAQKEMEMIEEELDYYDMCVINTMSIFYF